MRGMSVQEKFTKIHEKEADAIFRFSLLRTSDRDVAMDLTQDAFMKLWDKLSTKQVVENPRAFLFAVTRNAIIDWYRKKKTVSLEKINEDTEGEKEFAIIESVAEQDSEVLAILKILNSLDENYREVVYMRYVEELKPREIADILGENTNVISVRINRGLKELRKRFKI